MKKKSKASDRPRKSSPRSIDAARRIEQVFNRLKTEREAKEGTPVRPHAGDPQRAALWDQRRNQTVSQDLSKFASAISH